ncbi:NlpC/P60 family protein [Streptomyces sp. NPDC048269]|uniref:NlpC/P60 family protein n=1 Tax=Streptomyces sp. NPDC048269 TaxID=3155753 RepID=UPI003447A016
MAASADSEVITLSYRLLRAACIAAVLVTAGPLPVVHAGPLPTVPADPAAPATLADPPVPADPTAPTAPTAHAVPAVPTARPVPTVPADRAAPGAPAVRAEPTAGENVGVLLARLQGLYQKAEEASEAYNATEVALKSSQDEERRLAAESGRARSALGSERALLGQLAREQYQGSRGLSPYARMLLAGDPQAVLDQRRLVAREGARRAAVLKRLTRGERVADALAARARKALDSQQELAARRRQQKDEVAVQLKEVERVLASLTAEQLAQLGAREARDTAVAQRELVDSGRLPTRAGTPTAAGGAALTYAAAQIGKPYVWGAEGPGSFDCSGLTSQAWAHAGRAIPRTSQEQWARLPRVPLDQLRPGDLVVYFPKATHVGLYVGEGKVIQAPRPGAKVKVSPIAANPLLGAVRPDPDGKPLAEFTPPPLPEDATAGDDTGYSEEEAPEAPETDDATSAT